MGITTSPSDYTEINPNYTQGRGFYTNATEVANMLQIPAFSVSTYPTLAQVGNIIKRVEGIVDDKVKRSFRPILTKQEFHSFEYRNSPGYTLYGGYVGFVQLTKMKVRKVVSLQVWNGSNYLEIASAQAGITLQDNFRDLKSIILQLPNSGVSFTMNAENDITNLGNDEFCNTFGIKTTNSEIEALVNEEYPKTSQFTNASAAKELTSSNLSISDFFFAQKDTQDGTTVFFSSLLSGDDGTDCVIKVTTEQSCTANGSSTLTVVDSSKLAVGMEVSGTGISSGTTITSITNPTTIVLSASASAGTNILTFTSGTGIPTVCSVTPFTDKETHGRLKDYWLLNEEGRIFFLQEYPYHPNNSIIVSYLAGSGRVPSAIHEATTKMVAAEIIRHDDQSILIAETGANISTKEKYDILRNEAMAILKGKADLVYLL
tara:strand:+ start:464 stop:1756 length:1293 start_codon:yes stop_codon:yes gene_type:complete